MRQSAGLLLKNNLKDHYAATTEEFRKYIKVRRCVELAMTDLPKASCLLCAGLMAGAKEAGRCVEEESSALSV